MVLIKLGILFLVMLVMLIAFRRPMWLAVLCAVVISIPMFAIHPLEAGRLAVHSLTSASTLEILAVMYLVNVLQVMMQRRGAIDDAEKSMRKLFNNRRAITIFAPIFMGLLPAPNAVLLSAPIVDSITEDYLNRHEKTFLTSYLRHIPESALPLFPSLLLAITITGLSPALFVCGLLPLVLVGVLFPYFTVIRKVPPDTGLPPAESKAREALSIFKSLWPIIVLIVIVLFLGIQASFVTLGMCIILFFWYRNGPRDIWPILRKAFHPAAIGGMALTFILKDIIASTDAINLMITSFTALPIPSYLVYCMVLFIGGLAGLQNAVIAILFPVIFAVPGNGIPMLLVLMSFAHSAAQVSPTHICLEVAVRYYKSDFRNLILRTLPVTAVYLAFAIAYYNVLILVF